VVYYFSCLLLMGPTLYGPNPDTAYTCYMYSAASGDGGSEAIARRTAEDVRFLTQWFNGLGYSNSELPICETE
jgi:hypothetical protein